MAGANLPAKKYNKTTPTVTRLSFECSGGATEYIDIGLALNRINRRFARSGVYYYVNNVEVYNNETGVVDLHTLPDTYMTKNAWNLGLKKFLKMTNMVDIPAGKWNDFRVFMDNRHRTTGSLNPSLYGINAAFQTIDSSETAEYAYMTSADDDGDAIQDADNFSLHMLGPHVGAPSNWSSIGLITSYNVLRQQVSLAGDPVTHPDGPNDPLLNMFDFSSEEFLNEVAENKASMNDLPPYPATFMVGDNIEHMQHVARIGTELGVGRIGRAAGFCAPFGLICVDPHGVSSAFRVVITLAAGTYHGVYAERA